MIGMIINKKTSDLKTRKLSAIKEEPMEIGIKRQKRYLYFFK